VSLVTSPGTVLAHLTAPEARLGWLRALGPLAFLPILSRSALLAVLPVLGVALLSANTNQATLDLQYGLEAFPLLVACALLGLRRLGEGRQTARGSRAVLRADRPRHPRLVVLGAIALTTASVVAYVSSSRLPGGRAFDAASTNGLARRDAVESVLARIPPGASVSASSGLVAHIADRAQVNEYYPAGAEADFVVIDSQVWGPDDPRSGDDVNARGHLLVAGYLVVASAGGVTLWSR
jgi:hypothetical protein